MDALVENYLCSDGTDSDKFVKNISTNITTGINTMLQLMEVLHKELTTTDVDKRLKPLELISSVLAKMHPACLKASECDVIIEFLCTRLQDHFSLHPPTLIGLVTLSERDDLPIGVAEKIVKTIFKEVHVPSYMQSDRRAVYKIVSNLLENHTDELRKTSNDFVYGVISAVDGEQDPRNLLKVYDLLYTIVAAGFDLTKYAEEFFEVVGCYFPIDFEPPTNLSENKVVITNKQLVEGLRKVLTSSPLFAPYCVPLMLEKMESDIESAKIDSMTTLSQCFQIYTIAAVKPHLRSIWICIRKETMNSRSKDVEELGFMLLKHIVQMLSKAPQLGSKDSEISVFLKDVLEECLPRLTEHLQEKTAWSSAKLLTSCAEASKQSCKVVLSAMIPVLLKSLDSKNLMIAEKRLAMEIIVNALKAASLNHFDNDLSLHPLKKHKDDIIKLFCNCVSSKEFVHLRIVALAGIAALCNLGILITPDDQLTIVRSINCCLEYERDVSILNDLHLTCGFIASKWPDITLKYILPNLRDTFNNIFDLNPSHQEKCLTALSAISTRIEVISATCELIITQVLSQTVSEKNTTTILTCLSGLSTIVKRNVTNKECVQYFADTIILPLVEVCVKLSLSSVLPTECCSSCSGLQTFSSKCVTWPVVQRISEILRTVCQKLDENDTANNLSKNMINIIVECDLSLMHLGKTRSFNPFQYVKLPLQTRLVSLLIATLCAFDKKVSISPLDLLLEKLLNLCQETVDQPSYSSAAKCFAGLVNKIDQPSEELLDKVLQISNNLFEETLPEENKIATLSLVVWTTKALVLRSHPYAMNFADLLFRLFADEKLGKMAADSFDIILRDSEEVLNASCHACIRLMHKQRFFQTVLPKLTSGFQNAEDEQNNSMEVDDVMDSSNLSETKANYLTALSHLLRYLPKQVLNQHLTSLLPLLMKSLNGTEGALLVSVLSTLYNLGQEAKSTIEPHVEMLLENFIRLSTFKENMHVRIQALKCVGVLTLLPVSTLLPQKKRMVKSLLKAVDDKKRLVRKEAVKARTEWCLLGDV